MRQRLIDPDGFAILYLGEPPYLVYISPFTYRCVAIGKFDSDDDAKKAALVAENYLDGVVFRKRPRSAGAVT